MDYKEETREAYNRYSTIFEKKFGEHFELRVKREADLFIRALPGKRIVDLGCGPGNHAEYFAEQGLDVLCVDFSEEMVRICREKGLNAVVMDLEELDLPENSFDGVWAYTSLLHVPRKKFERVFERIAGLLKPRGVLGLAVKEGLGEGFVVEEEKYPGTRRWFTNFSDRELRAIFGERFELLSFSRQAIDEKRVFLDYLLKLKF